jgi:hypothetical protein
MPYPWSAGLLPEAVVLTAVGGIAAGIIGARVASAFRASEEGPARWRMPAPAAIAAAAALVVVLAVPLPRSGVPARATVVPFDTRAGSTQLRVAIDPPDAARGADWFRVVSIHGGSLKQVELRPVGRGTYVTAKRVPFAGGRDVVLRLARGSSMGSVTVYSLESDHHDEAIALGRRTAAFETEHPLPPVGGWREDLQRVGYGVVAAVAAFWLFWIWRALARLEGRPLIPPRVRRRLAGPRPA